MDDLDDIVEISEHDIAEELDYWNMSTVMFILGANPKIGMIDGYCRRLWGKQNVDKVIPIKRSLFLIRFLNIETRNKALDMKHLLFDNKPVFLKQWQDDMELDITEFNTVPVWVQLPNLPLKYWGCAEKLVQKLGDPIKPDSATANRDRINFVRYLVDMKISITFPDHIKIKNEKGVLIQQEVVYEWKPVQCNVCHIFGHEDSHCRKKPQQKQKQQLVWRPKSNQNEPNHHGHTQTTEGDEEQFQPVKKGSSARRTQNNIARSVPIQNTFDKIQEADTILGQEVVAPVQDPGKGSNEPELGIEHG